jgi:hypothetical protein
MHEWTIWLVGTPATWLCTVKAADEPTALAEGAAMTGYSVDQLQAEMITQ